MLFGATSMSQEMVQTFRVAGLSHIVVLSGFNIAILISFILLIFTFIPLALRVICAVIFVSFFVIAVDGEASVIRATLMSFIGLLALLIGRAYTARIALLVSLVCIIAYTSSHVLYDASLHLSFLATAGIIYMSEGTQKYLARIQSRTYKEIIATTLTAYLATLPYILFTFGSVSVYALFANLVVLPFVPLMMLVTFLLIPLSFISEMVTIFFGYIDTMIGLFILSVARLVEWLPFSYFTGTISFVTMCIMYALLIIIYSLIHNKKNIENNETLGTKDDYIISEIIRY